jgi:hypothetical protein
MHIVAIHSLKEDKQNMAGALAAVMGVTVYEALSRLRPPGSGPVVVAVFAGHDPAAELTAKLRSGGFHASLLTAGEIEAEARHWLVKKFTLGELELKVETAGGGSRTFAYQDIELILRGTGISHTTETKTSKERSISLGRALLTGGMMISKTTKTVREVTTQQREGFFSLYDGEGPPLFFNENVLVYETLGPALRLSRVANFLYLLAELRRRCPGAVYDERLLNRAGQATLLGPSLTPEEHLVVATALLAKVLRAQRKEQKA